MAEADELIAALVSGHRRATVPPADRVMLDYAVQLTERPASVTADDVERLRAVGFDDRAIHDICSITAYFAFVNRVADGLGVEIEDRFGR